MTQSKENRKPYEDSLELLGEQRNQILSAARCDIIMQESGAERADDAIRYLNIKIRDHRMEIHHTELHIREKAPVQEMLELKENGCSEEVLARVLHCVASFAFSLADDMMNVERDPACVSASRRRRYRRLRSFWRHECMAVRMALATAAHHSSQRVSSAFTQTEYVAPAPVTECVVPAPSSSSAAPAPVIEYTASPPVNLNMASPPCAATATLSPHQPNTLRGTSLRSSELKPLDVVNVVLLFLHGLARVLQVDLITHQRVVAETRSCPTCVSFFPMKRGGAPTVHISPFCVTHGNVSSVTLMSSSG